MELNNIIWNKEKYNKLAEYLKEISDDKYKKFHENLVPGEDNILGIQLPKLRVIAKKISMGNYEEYLKFVQHTYYEETMLQGLVIGYVKADYEKTVELINTFLPHITNWAICDSFCTKFRGIKENEDVFLNFLQQCIAKDEEYYIRFAVVMLKVMYNEEKYIDKVLDILDNISHDGYYVKMAVAWTLCDLFIKFEDKTMKYFKSCKLDNFTYNKALQKIIESYRVDKETKEIIRSMKRKGITRKIILTSDKY